jgi:hypothetical protein
VGLALGQPAAARYPAGWFGAVHCIHRYEVGLGAYSDEQAWPLRWADKHNSASRGGVQFLYDTWARAVARHGLRGYPRDPADASRAQQLFVAWLVYLDDRRSFHEWATAPGCGLR